MDKERMAELEKIEAYGAENGWVAPMAEEDKAFFAYFRSVFKRYNISPSKATRLEYDFVTRVAESEFYLQKTTVNDPTQFEQVGETCGSGRVVFYLKSLGMTAFFEDITPKQI